MMSTLSTENRRAQAGFTLVELAIVLVIVGLLIGGILKGQELIAATRVNSTVSQIKAIDAATYTFKDTYGSLPGDLPNANSRLSNCDADSGCATGSGVTTTGNGHLDGNFYAAINMTSANTTEGQAFFVQLGVAELIGGINSPSTTAQIGKNILGTPLDSTSNYRAGYETGDYTDADGTMGVGGTLVAGTHYLALNGYTTFTNSLVSHMTGNGILGKSASSIDTKMDDGVAGTGSILGLTQEYGGTSNDDCLTAADNTATYRAIPNKSCGLLIKFQQ